MSICATLSLNEKSNSIKKLKNEMYSDINYPPYNLDFDSLSQDQLKLFNGKHSIEKQKYVTRLVEKNYLAVFEYTINNQVIMWDYSSGYVHLTGIWKALGNLKADIVKLIENCPELDSNILRIRGGCLKIQGTWLPYDIAKLLASRTCYHIRYCLIPLFGPDFPDSCLQPFELGFGQLQINPSAPSQKRKRKRINGNNENSHLRKHSNKIRKSCTIKYDKIVPLISNNLNKSISGGNNIIFKSKDKIINNEENDLISMKDNKSNKFSERISSNIIEKNSNKTELNGNNLNENVKNSNNIENNFQNVQPYYILPKIYYPPTPPNIGCNGSFNSGYSNIKFDNNNNNISNFNNVYPYSPQNDVSKFEMNDMNIKCKPKLDNIQVENQNVISQFHKFRFSPKLSHNEKESKNKNLNTNTNTKAIELNMSPKVLFNEYNNYSTFSTKKNYNNQIDNYDKHLTTSQNEILELLQATKSLLQMSMGKKLSVDNIKYGGIIRVDNKDWLWDGDKELNIVENGNKIISHNAKYNENFLYTSSLVYENTNKTNNIRHNASNPVISHNINDISNHYITNNMSKNGNVLTNNGITNNSLYITNNSSSITNAFKLPPIRTLAEEEDVRQFRRKSTKSAGMDKSFDGLIDIGRKNQDNCEKMKISSLIS